MVSHTATGEWQSFEFKMRRRRAERMLLRAEVAIEAGCMDEARQCLDEAQSLARDLPGIAHLEARMAQPPAPSVPSRFGSRTMWALALAALCVAFGVGWWSFNDQMAQLNVEADAGDPPADAPVAAAEPGPLAATARVQSESDSTVPRRAPGESPATTTPGRIDAPATVQVPIRSGEILPIVGNVPPPQAAPLEAKEDPLVPPLPAPSAPVAPLALDTAVPPPSIAIAAPAVELSQESLVRSVLNRYASAYSALDVDAATRVWPTVNRGALSRAFDGLASQRLALGDCRVDVAGNKARARCSGTATWSPRVGSGTYSEARAWTFDLVRVGAAWQILNARAQNR